MKRKLWILVALVLLLQAVCAAASGETEADLRRAEAAVKKARERVEAAQQAVMEAE